MKAIILQHEKSTPPGTTIDWLKKKGISAKIVKLFESEKLPDLSAFEILIICGGSMNVDQDSQYSWMAEEKKLIHDSINANKCVIGLCLGAQMIATALGAQVQRHSTTEVGWHEVGFKENSSFKLGPSLKVFQWHSYTFALPKGALLIATNQACLNQGFSFNDNVLAFQFHPESSEEWIIECANDPELPSGEYCQSKEEILEMKALQVPLQVWYFKTLDHLLINWLSSNLDPNTLVDLEEE